MDRVKAEDSLEPAKATGTWSCRVAVKPIHWILCKRWQQRWNGWFYLFIYLCSNLYHFAMPPFSTSHKLSNCPSVAIAPRTLQSKMRGVRMRKSAALKKLELVGESGTPSQDTEFSSMFVWSTVKIGRFSGAWHLAQQPNTMPLGSLS